MECPECHTENNGSRKFCRECGNKLLLVCPDCNAENSPGDKFCGECGQDLTFSKPPLPKDISLSEKFDKIQRYLPKGLTDKILAQKKRIEGERRVVTIMFCDMKGFTPLTEKLGPEETFSFMDKVFEIFIHKVHEYEGIVNEMRGDGILAFFGVPITLEDAPQRAIRSAYAIHREMVKFNETIIEQRDIPPVLIRIGINTGPVVVGTVGNDLRVQFTAVGDTINMASRVENLAEPGTTYVTEDTFKLTEGFFRFEALGKKEIKGKKEQIKVYRVIAPNARRARFDVSAEGGLTPFIGRNRELELLIDGFERVKNGRGQALSIVSEAGRGKSRLLYEFRKAIANENITFLEGKCLSYSRRVAYHPVIDIIKSNFEIEESDSEPEIIEKVKKGLKDIGVDEASTLPYLLELLSVKAPGIEKLSMSLEEKKDRTAWAVNRITLKGSEVRPLIIAIEDLHWIDRGSEDYFKDLLDHISGMKIFLIFTYRPEFDPTWSGRSYHSQVTLNRLSNRDSASMVTSILGEAELDGELKQFIFDKTEGVPFFIEEFLKSFNDLNLIEKRNNKYYLPRDSQKVSIPFTINEVVMARVDALDEGAKELLQAGSAIEREFSFELIKHVTGYSEEDLLLYLSALRDSELIYERGMFPESTYIFKHALTREVVYGLILTEKKKMLHDRIGAAIEDLYNQNIHEYYGVLVRHFIESGNYKKAAEYSRLEAKKAQKAASYVDAIEHANVSIFCLERLQQSDKVMRKTIDARAVLAGYYLSLSKFSEAKEAVEPIFSQAIELNYEKKLPQLYNAMGAYKFWVNEEFPDAVAFFKKGRIISDKVKNYASLWFSTYFLGITVSGLCKFDKGLKHFTEALDLSLKGKNPVSISFTKGAMSAFNYHYQGKIDDAYRSGKEALKIAEQINDIYVRGMASISYGIPCYLKGLYEEAENNLIAGLDLCNKSSLSIWSMWANFWLGELFVEKGLFQKAVKFYEQGISVLTKHGEIFPSWARMFKVCIARSKILTNDQDINISDLFDYYSSNKMAVLEGFMARYIGEILLSLRSHPTSDIEKWITIAVEADKKNSAKWLLGCDYALYAELHKQNGKKR